jgi:hypothetical protein
MVETLPLTLSRFFLLFDQIYCVSSKPGINEAGIKWRLSKKIFFIKVLRKSNILM